MSGNHWVFGCATKAASHGASKEHNELSAPTKSPPTVREIAAHLVCCHATTLLLFLQTYRSSGFGKQRGPDRSEPRWLGLLADWVALLPKPHLQDKYFHSLPLVFVFIEDVRGIKQRRLLHNKSIKTRKGDDCRCLKNGVDKSEKWSAQQHHNRKYQQN